MCLLSVFASSSDHSVGGQAGSKMLSKQDVFTKQGVFFKQDVLSKQDAFLKQDVFLKQCVVAKQRVCWKQCLCFSHWSCRCLCECAGLYIWFSLEPIKVNLLNKFQIWVRHLYSLHVRYKFVIIFIRDRVNGTTEDFVVLTL